MQLGGGSLFKSQSLSMHASFEGLSDLWFVIGEDFYTLV